MESNSYSFSILIIDSIKADPRGKNLRRVWDYIHKSSDTVHQGNWSGPTKIEDQGSKKNWSKIAAATVRADAAELLIALQPKERITAFGNTEAWLNATFPEEKKTYVHPEGMADFVSLPRAMVDWVTACIQSENPVLRPKALIVWGPSRTGKTKWARSLGKSFFTRAALSTKYIPRPPHLHEYCVQHGRVEGLRHRGVYRLRRHLPRLLPRLQGLDWRSGRVYCNGQIPAQEDNPVR